MAYSNDYRQMILGKLEAGYSYRELAYEYQISPTTILNWKNRPERKKPTGRPKTIDPEALRKDVELYPDDFQWERAARFNCTQRGIGLALKRLNITQKKDSKTSTSE